jgi:hypothetical protein
MRHALYPNPFLDGVLLGRLSRGVVQKNLCELEEIPDQKVGEQMTFYGMRLTTKKQKDGSVQVIRIA